MQTAVVGAGVMGTGIAQLLASNGHEVRLSSRTEAGASAARGRIFQTLTALVKKGRMSVDEAEAVHGRIAISNSIGNVELVIEAVAEDVDVKRTLLAELDGRVPSGALLASNTSTLPITLLAAATSHPERVLGMHFFNPAPVMEGVELIRGRLTSDDTVDRARSFVEGLGKKPVVAQDYAGFITSRLTNLYLNEAARAVMDGNRPEDVDAAMLHCLKMPMGPCALMDLIGLDVVLACLGTLQAEFGERFQPAPLLKQMARAGQLGRKTGQGFYAYQKP